MTDYTRYEPGNDGVGRLAIFCIDCGTEANDVAIWTEDDTAEQVTPLSLANWIAHADEHEALEHASSDVGFLVNFSLTGDPVGDGVCAFMNANHPDPNGGKWTTVVLNDGAEAR
jgi:hypothetical protein